jgi:dephospho-CoA kinase
LKEAALLFDAGSYLHLDAVIVVSAQEELRITRVMARDHSSRQAVLARMKKQWPESRRLQLADFTVKNDGESLLIPQVQGIHKHLLA